MDSLLLYQAGLKTLAYANDLVLIARNKLLNHISKGLQIVLNFIMELFMETDLTINPYITNLMLLTKKITTNFIPPVINNIALNMVKELKRLDFTLDLKLYLSQHINSIVNKAIRYSLPVNASLGHGDLITKILCDCMLALSGS